MEKKGVKKEEITKNKKSFVEPEMEVTKLSEKDVVTASYGVKLNW